MTTQTWMMIGLALAATSCATTFKGDPHVENGASGCAKKCSDWGLDFAGMVAMGEYSDGCICTKRGAAAGVQTPGAAAATGPAAAGVVMQMQRAAQQSQH